MPRSMVFQLTKCAGIVSLITVTAFGQKVISCRDGDHIQIDVRQIAIQYDASSIAGTVSSLSILSTHLQVAHSQLQEAAATTQQMNEFIKALATGYNSCAVTRQQYAEGLTHIYPRLKEDGVKLEAIRKLIADGQTADSERLQSILDTYTAHLRQFADLSGRQIILKRIKSISTQINADHRDAMNKANLILQKLDEMDHRNAAAPPPTPKEVSATIHALHERLLDQTRAAEDAYDKGYELLNQYRFREAIPFLQQALEAVPVADFYVVLGRAYWESQDLVQAENILQRGLSAIAGKDDREHEAKLDNLLGSVASDKGDIRSALLYTQRAIAIDEAIYGASDPQVAGDANNLAAIHQDKGELDLAYSYAKQALDIDEKVYGSSHPTVARDENNIGQILEAKADLDGALTYTQKAMEIEEKIDGPDHPRVAVCANNIGQILKARKDLDGANRYMQRALQIEEKSYGPDHPLVAIVLNNIGGIMVAESKLDDALTYLQRALRIDERCYGNDNTSVAKDLYNIGFVLKAKGDLDGALGYALRAHRAMTNSSGADSPNAKKIAATIQQLQDAQKAREIH